MDKLRLSVEASNHFIQSISDNSEPNERIKKAAELYRKKLGKNLGKGKAETLKPL